MHVLYWLFTSLPRALIGCCVAALIHSHISGLIDCYVAVLIDYGFAALIDNRLALMIDCDMCGLQVPVHREADREPDIYAAGGAVVLHLPGGLHLPVLAPVLLYHPGDQAEPLH